MLQFKDFELINESLDTPVIDFILTDDSNLPSSAYYQFKIEDTMYSVILSLSSSKGLYKMHAGSLPSGKNLKLWKIKPNHVRKFLSTAILIIDDAISDRLHNKIFGLAIRLPKEIKKSYIDLTAKVINYKYKKDMKVLPVSKAEEDDNFNYIFVAKQGQNIQKLFSSKDFTAYNFSKYTEIPTKALENLADKRFVKKTNLSDKPLYKDFSINSETEELRELAHKIVTNVNPMKKVELSPKSEKPKTKIKDDDKKIKLMLSNIKSSDVFVSDSLLASILLEKFPKYFNFLKKDENEILTDDNILKDMNSILEECVKNPSAFGEISSIQKTLKTNLINNKNYPTIKDKWDKWYSRINMYYRRSEESFCQYFRDNYAAYEHMYSSLNFKKPEDIAKIKQHPSYKKIRKQEDSSFVLNIKYGLKELLDKMPETYPDLTNEDELSLLFKSSSISYFFDDDFGNIQKPISLLLLEKYPRLWSLSKKLYKMSNGKYWEITNGNIADVPEKKEITEYFKNLIEYMDKTKGKKSEIFKKMKIDWDNWKSSYLSFLDKEQKYNKWIEELQQWYPNTYKEVIENGGINSPNFIKKYEQDLNLFINELFSTIKHLAYLYTDEIFPSKKGSKSKLTLSEIYESDSVFEKFETSTINFNDVYKINSSDKFDNYFHSINDDQILILDTEHKNQTNLKMLDNLIGKSQIYNYTQGTSEFNAPLRSFFKQYNKNLPISENQDLKYNIEQTVKSWYNLCNMYNVIKPTTQDLVVFRGTTIPDTDHDWKEDVITDPGFLSTSASFHKAMAFKSESGSLLIIRVPSGSKIIPANGYSDYSSENEYILPPLSILKAYKVMKFETSQYVFVDYIGNGMESMIEKIREFFPGINNEIISNDDSIKYELKRIFKDQKNNFTNSFGDIMDDSYLQDRINEIISNVK